MTFEETLDQAIAMLQRRGRLTYSTLKRQFQLDDAALEDLKNELIEGQRLAVDERGNVLVWTGGADVPQLGPSPTTADVQPTQGLPPAAASRPLDAERRQLTVMFCDLVDSTRLSSQLDPEEYRDVVRAYQAACTEVIRRYDGHVAQLLGDGLLVYFGYPHAHEDDAQRAVRTALGILAAMDDLHARFPHAQGRTLAVRLGIHTGLVVIGAMGDQGHHEHLALGETPNIAARIQGLTQPKTVAISAATYRLVQGYFACQDLGAHALRGVTEAMRLYHVLGESGATSRLDVAQPRGLTPLVGRESEVTLLRERWEQAKAGHGHVVLLTGDGGLGKSRLVQVLKDHVAHEPYIRWECRSAEYYQNTALFPLIELFQRLWHFEAQEMPDAKLAKLEHALGQYRLPLEETVPLFAPFLALPVPDHRYPPLALSPQRQRQKTLETIVAILLELAERHPVLFIVEDLHWTDPTTLELLHLVLAQTPTASMLVLLTCRPHFQPGWTHRSYLTEVSVTRLAQPQVARIVECVAGENTVPAEVLQQIIAKTDGVPLFVEEMTKALLESGHLKDMAGHYERTGTFSTLAIPATLHDALMARLDRLVTAKAVAQYAAVIGRQFAYELLQAVSQLDASTLQRELGRLVEAEIVYQRGLPPQATYTFKHALIQDAAYQSLLKSTRQHYHQRIAQVLEAQFPETTEAEPELLAHHYTEAGLTGQAMPYWQRAGERAVQRSAYIEAIRHFTKGLEGLTTLPDTPERTQHELVFHIALGRPLMATKGFSDPEVGRVYTRARELCRQVGESPQLFLVLAGLHAFYNMRGESRTALELAQELLTLAQRVQDPAYLMRAHRNLGTDLQELGELAAARAHLEASLALRDPQRDRARAFLYGGQDAEVSCLRGLARSLWLLGYPDQALASIHTALTRAQELAHPFSLGEALYHAASLHQLRREVSQTQERAEAAMALARDQGFPSWLLYSTIVHGWALAAQGQHAQALTEIPQALTALQATGQRQAWPYYLAQLAEAYGRGGDAAAGLQRLAEALAVVDDTEECWWEAELYRLKGELLLQQATGSSAEAEACLHRASDIARRQQAKSLELRAAMSLARLWQQQGKHAEAHALLAPVYSWFTEGFDTADLQEAKALLEALA